MISPASVIELIECIRIIENQIMHIFLAFGVKKDTVSEEIHIKVVSELSKSEVFEVCRKYLATYQLPDVIDVVEDIPKNASGKVIRNAERNGN